MHHEHSELPEPWVTKQQLADHLSVTRRWIEQQQTLGLPHLHTGGMNRYRISEIEAWLHDRYGSPARKRLKPEIAYDHLYNVDKLASVRPDVL